MTKIDKLRAAAKKNDRERRFTPGTVELRAEGEGDDKTLRIVGYALLFGKRSVNLGGFTEIIAEGAADDVLLDPDTRGLFNHDRNWVLGRNGNTMTLRVDSTGLEYDIDPPDTQAGNDVSTLVARGDVNQSSFGFSVAEGGESWTEDEDTGAITRTITKIGRLFDVSPVTFPAYPDTAVAMRSFEDYIVEAEGSTSTPGSDNSDNAGIIPNDSESESDVIVRLTEQTEVLTKTVKRLEQALDIAERMNQ